MANKQQYTHLPAAICNIEYEPNRLTVTDDFNQVIYFFCFILHEEKK